MNATRLRAVVLALGVVSVCLSSARATASEVPDFAVTTLDGQTITRASLQGKPALLMFWASWCDTCQHELPNVKALYERNKGKGLQAVAIGFQDEEAAIRSYVQSHRSTFVFPAAYDAGNRVSTLFRARATPTFVLLDAQGRVALVHAGGGILQNPAFQKLVQAL